MKQNQQDEMEIPDPSGPPERVTGGYTLKRMIGEMVVVTLVGGTGVVILLGGQVHQTRGGTRSAHLKWQKTDQTRIVQIQQSMNEEETAD